jgi:hypothetical protein
MRFSSDLSGAVVIADVLSQSIALRAHCFCRLRGQLAGTTLDGNQRSARSDAASTGSKQKITAGKFGLRTFHDTLLLALHPVGYLILLSMHKITPKNSARQPQANLFVTVFVQAKIFHSLMHLRITRQSAPRRQHVESRFFHFKKSLGQHGDLAVKNSIAIVDYCIAKRHSAGLHISLEKLLLHVN